MIMASLMYVLGILSSLFVVLPVAFGYLLLGGIAMTVPMTLAGLVLWKVSGLFEDGHLYEDTAHDEERTRLVA